MDSILLQMTTLLKSAKLNSLSFFALLSLTSSTVTAAPIRFATAAQYLVNDYVNQLAIADFTRDGNLDIALVIGPGGGVSILPGSSNGVFGPLQTTVTDYYIPKVLTLADFNGDRLPDLAVAGSHNVNGGVPYGLQSFLGQANGVLASVPYQSLTYSINNMISGKFTGDQKSDLVTTVTQPSGQNGVLVFPGLGDGTFGPEQFTPIANSNPLGLVAGDFNGDGKLDLAVTDQNSSGVWILLGEGNGFFQNPIEIPLSERTNAIAAGDLNRDGKMDLVVAGTTEIFSLLGNGDGTFQAPQGFPAGKVPRSLVVVDLNCDGFPDVATANFNGPGVSVLQGNGDGTFGAPQLLTAGTEPVWIASGDFNRDGRPDLAVANFISMSVSIYLNTTSASSAGCKV